MHTMVFPGYTIGQDAYEAVANICQKSGKKVAIIGGKTALSVAEKKIVGAISGSSLESIGTFWYGGEASDENIEMLREKTKQADMFFAVGGGKAIDTVKVLAQTEGKDLFTFPTIASTCAATTGLGILYHPNGSLSRYSFSDIFPNHIFIDTDIIATAPEKYLWAGIGDTMAKHYESTISSRGHNVLHSDGMGVALGHMCASPMLHYGKQAMQDCKTHTVSEALTQTILGIVITTGLVSNLVQVDYTTGLAHAIYNGFTVLSSTEEYGHLHGEIVAYGILIMLSIDKQYEARDRIIEFYSEIGLPRCLKDLHATPDDLLKVTEKAFAGIDIRVFPYPVTHEMVVNAAIELDNLARG